MSENVPQAPERTYRNSDELVIAALAADLHDCERDRDTYREFLQVTLAALHDLTEKHRRLQQRLYELLRERRGELRRQSEAA